MYTDTQTGAFATTELVGREKELQKILERIQDPARSQPCIIFVKGPGGIGKTRLLNEVIKKFNASREVKVSSHLIDAYHLLYHTPIEFVQAVYESLSPLNRQFREYEKNSRVLQYLVLSGEAVQVELQVETTLNSFVQELRSYVGRDEQRVVIVLDTVERYVYNTEEAQPDNASNADAWVWLTSQLASLSNVIVLAAGREEAEPLFTSLDPAIEIMPLEVDRFSRTAAQAYFRAAADMARQNSDEHVARRLESLTPGEIEDSYPFTDGKPILLSLMADYVANGGLLQTLFDQSRSETGAQPQAVFRKKILERLLSLAQLGEFLRYMALMPKGVDAELLQVVMNLPQSRVEDAERHLGEIEKFSFIKQRFDTGQKRKIYFLHDELYEMLKTEAFETLPQIGLHEKKTIYQRVIDYYEERFKKVRRQLADLYSVVQAGGGNEMDREKLKDLSSRRAEILLALLYYRLRENPSKGYRRWYRYDHEAIVAGDLSFSIQLQFELMAYIRELTSGKEKEAFGWDTDLVQWSIRLRPVKHAWAKGKNRLVFEETQKLEAIQPDDSTDNLKRSMFLTWKAYALVYSDPPAAHQQIELVIHALETHVESDETRQWLRQALLSFAYRIRGYAYRVQEMIDDAILFYSKAAVLLREVDLKVEMATVNNDLGFALMLKGESSDARSLVLNALGVRSDLGLGMQVVASLTTLAIIDTYEGRYVEAIENATKSLRLARGVGSNRRIGLALIALAEATRRQCSAWVGADVNERIKLLQAAYENAGEALDIFEELDENSRKVEALIEKGCARRDAVHLVQISSTPLYGKDRWIKESRMALEEAARIAEGLFEKPGPGEKRKVHFRQADAIINMAWLGFYAGGEDGEAIRQEAETRAEALLQEYELPAGKSKPDIHGTRDYQPLLSTQLGKLYVLRGHKFYQEHEDELTMRIKGEAGRADVSRACGTLATYYFLGLEHSALYSPEYRDLRLVKQQIFDSLKILRPENLEVFVECVAELEKYYGMAAPVLSQLRQLLVKRALVIQ